MRKDQAKALCQLEYVSGVYSLTVRSLRDAGDEWLVRILVGALYPVDAFDITTPSFIRALRIISKTIDERFHA